MEVSSQLMSVFVLMSFVLASSATNDNVNVTENIFVTRLMNRYGTNGTLSISQLQTLMQNIMSTNKHSVEEESHVETESDMHSISPVSVGLSSEQSNEKLCTNNSTDVKCHVLKDKCLSASAIFAFHSVPESGVASLSDLRHMSPTILYQAQHQSCYSDQHEIKHKPLVSEVWGYGFLCVTFINICALMGMVFLPLMKKSYYNRLLMFMVALAVGTLAGNSILFLIPEAFHLVDEELPPYVTDTYVWKSTTVMGGIYMFFLTERILKIIMTYRQRYRTKNMAKEENEDEINMGDLPVSSLARTFHIEESMNMSFKVPPQAGAGPNIHESASKQGLLMNPDLTMQISNGAVKEHKKELQHIKPVAWMVIFGDGLHNFIDGLSIGAAFSESILTGVSVSLAVICEELPHELGDFAILLNSGMTMKQALTYNFLSACMCYLGLIFGIIVGEMTSGGTWIFALAGGMFLYISLVDMFPEVNHAAEEEEKETGRVWSIFLLQNAGLLSGYGIMIFMAYYGQHISLEGS